MKKQFSKAKWEKALEENKKDKVWFSSTHTLDSFIKGKSEQLIREFKFGRIRISIWKEL